MHQLNARARESLRLALLLSLLLHAAILLIHLSSSAHLGEPATNVGKSSKSLRRLVATLAQLPKPAPTPTPPTSAPHVAPRHQAAAKQPILAAPHSPWTARAWSPAEKSDMDKFLNEPATPAQLPTPPSLSEKAVAMARALGRAPEEEASGEPPAGRKHIEAFSLEMYFDAFVRKLNRSAAFVKNDPRPSGKHKALVQIFLNPDGTLKNFRVLRSADQQAEIAYIKSVLDFAAPFSAFPADIRGATDTLSIQMCILPSRIGESGGFSRSSGQDCRD